MRTITITIIIMTGEQWDNYGGSLGNVTMLFKEGEIQTTKTTTETGEHDPLTNTRRVKPISIQNRFEAFQDDNETDEDEDENANNDSQTKSNRTVAQSTNVQKRKPNKRQRQRRQQLCDMHTWDTHTTDAWLTTTQSTDISKAAAWCPGPEHCGSLHAITNDARQHTTKPQKQDDANCQKWLRQIHSTNSTTQPSAQSYITTITITTHHG